MMPANMPSAETTSGGKLRDRIYGAVYALKWVLCISIFFSLILAIPDQILELYRITNINNDAAQSRILFVSVFSVSVSL
jgi:hypothetical protein